MYILSEFNSRIAKECTRKGEGNPDICCTANTGGRMPEQITLVLWCDPLLGLSDRLPQEGVSTSEERKSKDSGRCKETQTPLRPET